MDARIQSRFAQAERVSRRTLAANLLLSLLKLAAGVTFHSAALTADAVHSVSDSVSTVAILVGMRIAKQPPDRKHPYGHGRAETVAAKLLSLLLLFVGANMAYSGIRALVLGDFAVPGTAAALTAVLSIAVKEWMYRYTIKTARSIRSRAMLADAWHQRSDALSSAAALAGILLARLGYPLMDPLVAVVVSVFILRVGWRIFQDVIDELMDAQVSEPILESVSDAALSVSAIRDVKRLAVHRHGSEYHVDLTVSLAAQTDVERSHSVVHAVEDAIQRALLSSTHVDVHVEPEGLARDSAGQHGALDVNESSRDQTGSSDTRSS